LRALIDGTHPAISAIPREEMSVLLERLKTFAKRVHRTGKRGREERRDAPRGSGLLENTMPFEVAQVLYNLAGALAPTRCEARIIGLSDAQFRTNLAWVLSQPWLEARLRPVFFDAMTRLGSGGAAARSGAE